MLSFCQWCVFLATAPLVLCHEDIHIECSQNSALVRWKVSEDLAKNPSRLFLGNCLPSEFSRSADGRGEAMFQYPLSQCHFRPKRREQKVSYENHLTFRPLPQSPASLIFPVKCTLERPEWMPPFVEPASEALHGEGGLVFHMALLNDDLSGPALSNSYPLGSIINIWASVEQQLHQPLMLHLDECVASPSSTLHPHSPTYPIITNKGCLVDGMSSISRFLPRYWPSSLLLQLQAFSFGEEEEQVFIHCRLTIWDPEDLNEEKKSCNYNKELGRWELLDDPAQNFLCTCCDFSCQRRLKRSLYSGTE